MRSTHGSILRQSCFLCWLVVLGAAAAVRAFDGNQLADLAVGAPYENVNGAAGAGAVNVLYGAGGGLSETDNQLWSRASGLIGGLGADDHVGQALAACDFDGDGFNDLAIGAPFEDVGAETNAGAVNVVYGAAGGLAASGSQRFTQDSVIGSGASAAQEYFGWSLACGDFDHDGYSDLAISAPDETVGGHGRAGSVLVLSGSHSGLVASHWSLWSAMLSDGSAVVDGNFGETLTVGDFNHDDYADLAVGSPGAVVNDHGGAGIVFVLRGSFWGLVNPPGTDIAWHQDRSGIASGAADNDRFGASVATGDFDGDDYDDLVIGVPNEAIGLAVDAGMIHVLFGSSSGVTAAGSQIFHQDSANVPNNAESYDRFGAALAAADFDGDGYDDVAVGVPFEDYTASGTTLLDVGLVHILYGSSAGVTADAPHLDLFYESTLHNGGEREEGDQFGRTLAAGDFDADGHADLAIASPYEDVTWHSGNLESAGAVYVLYGTPTDGLSADNQCWTQCTSGVLGGCESGDRFGLALAATPRLSGMPSGLPFSDGFESGDTSAWSMP